MTETTILYTSIVFYIAVITLLTISGFAVTESESLLELPQFLVIEELTNIPVIGGLLNFVVGIFPWLFLFLGYLFNLITFSLTALLPSWLNILLFVPLALIMVYIVIKIFRGN